MKKNFIIASFLSYLTFIFSMEATVYVYDNNSPHTQTVTEALQTSNIPFEYTTSINSHDTENLYIIFDAFNLTDNTLPKNYITYQSLNLTQNSLTNSYLNTLTNSVAVWDYSLENISRYQGRLYNYYYMPKYYEHTDPVILPCSLPISLLDTYKELLIYSNQKDTDISSHLPALFYHTILQNPKIIIEAGVRGGESTKPLHKAATFCNALMIGLDIHPMWAKVSYDAMDNAFCLEMDDLNFGDYYTSSPFKNEKIDLIFIDTSHEYMHTLQEITLFVPFLSEDGALMFHDSNVTPLPNGGYVRLNGSKDFAPGNPRGVPQALKEYFSLEFDEYTYVNTTFTHNEITWHMTHYPFCNGLTILKKQIQTPSL